MIAGWLTWLEPGPTLPIAATPDVAPEQFRPSVRAALLTDPPAIPVGGFEHRCNECHRLFASAVEMPARRYQHTTIRFDHGLNDRCFNCHDITDRERLVVRDGTTIPFSESPRLCAQCHGPTYRDWERGTHGKTLGGWDQSHPGRRRLVCAECHDPHAPAFDPIEPLPAPNTLRMGRQSYPDAHHAYRPLALPPEHRTDDAGSAEPLATPDAHGADAPESTTDGREGQ